MFRCYIMTALLPVILAVSLAAAKPAPKEPPKEVEKIALIDLDTPPTMIGMGAQVTRALQAAAIKEKLQVVTSEDLRARLGEKKYQELVKCAGKPACVAQSLVDLSEITRAVSGSLSIDDKSYYLRLSLIDLKTLTVTADVDRLILIASRRFQRDVEVLSGPLLRGEREARGTLIINANVKNAQVTVNGEFLGVAPVTLQLKPGKHEVRVERPKYLPVQRLVDVEPNKTNTTDIRLILKPGEQADADEIPKLVAKDPNAETAGFHVRPGTLVAGGAAIVAFGIGTVFGIQSSSTEKTLISGYDKMTMLYAGTRADAIAARSNALIADIFFGVAGAAVIVTGILLFLDIRAASSPVTVTPAAGPGGGALLIGGHF
jgi:hypothetical protein